MAASSGSAGSTGPGGPVSFGFSRKAERRRLLAAGPCSEPENDGADTDYLTAVEDRELLSAKPAPPPPKDLVIPLRPARRWRNPEAPSSAPSSPGHAPSATNHAPLASGHALEGDPITLEIAALQELLREARQSQEHGQETPSAAPIPMRMKEDNVGSGALPTPEDYAAVPVSAFGMAMLRGMGWKKGEGIGRTFKRVVKPLEQRLRPRGLGLGAEPAPPPSSSGPLNSGGGGRREDPHSSTGGGLRVGDDVRIQSGPHRGVCGKVEALDPETARAVVRLQLGGQAVTVSQHSLTAHRAPPQRPPGAEEGSQPPPPPTPNSSTGKRRRSPEGRTAKQSRAPPHWLRRDLRVRCVDRGFRGGRFYNCKMQVEDLLSPDSCVCRTDDGRLVEGLQEAMLETVIPRGPNDRVMVVLGEHRGQVGRILERDPERGRAVVQLRGGVLTLGYDSLCHFLGGDDDDD